LCTSASIEVTSNKTLDTLTEYIDERFGNLDLNYNDHSITFGIQIKTTILAKANGTFLWANPAFDMLQGRRTKGDIEDCLEDVPPGVDTMIEHVLNTYRVSLLEDEYREMVLIMVWLSHFLEPLTLSEITAMLDLALPTKGLVVPLEGRLRHKYASFVSVLRDDGLSTSVLQERENKRGSKPESTTVVFAHASIQQWFSKMSTTCTLEQLSHNASGFSNGPLSPLLALSTIVECASAC
jgi:hypothetical protein